MERSLSDSRGEILDSSFKQRVLEAVAKIPKGKVMSYGQVAAIAGSPRAARQVGGILRNYDGDDSLPWWRVINSAGQISIKGNFFATPDRQRELLRAEKVEVSSDYKVDMDSYQYQSKM